MLPATERMGIAEDDGNALEVLACAKTFASKLKEARPLVTEGKEYGTERRGEEECTKRRAVQ